MKRGMIIFGSLVIILLKGYSQNLNDTLKIELPTVELNAHVYPEKKGFTNLAIDSTDLFTSLTSDAGSFLQRFPGIFIKQYGNGSLSTISVRGTTASQTKIYWNGLPVHSPMLGQADLSLIPIYLLTGAEIMYGNSGLSMGTGGFGASVMLESEAKKPPLQLAEIFFSANSFLNFQNMISVSYRKPSNWGTIKMYSNTAKNRFRYRNTARWMAPIETEKHATNSQKGILLQHGFSLNNKSIFTSEVWLQSFFREIPPLMTNNPAGEFRTDKSLRAHLGYDVFRKKGSIKANMGFNTENLVYENNQLGLKSISRFKGFYIDGEKEFKLDNTLFTIAKFQFTLEDAFTDAYTDSRTRNTIAFINTWSFNPVKPLTLNLTFRPQINDYSIYQLPFNAAIEYDVFANNKLRIYANSGRNLNMPTLNDLYWTPGGNIDLLPEQSLNNEGGVKLHFIGKSKKTLADAHIIGFTNLIENFISWVPTSTGLWQAVNYSQVHARGFEFFGKFRYNSDNIYFQSDFNYSYTRSDQRSNDIKSQMTYIPVHQVKVTQMIVVLKNCITLDYNYVSSRNSPEYKLPSYQIIDISLSREWKIYKSKGLVQLNCTNLLAESYQVVAWRPMPGRGFELCIKIKLDK